VNKTGESDGDKVGMAGSAQKLFGPGKISPDRILSFHFITS
jgi:hypothetical protein